MKREEDYQRRLDEREMKREERNDQMMQFMMLALFQQNPKQIMGANLKDDTHPKYHNNEDEKDGEGV